MSDQTEAKPRLKFEATQDHINRGEIGNGTSCALALAIGEATGARRVVVCDDYIDIDDNNAGIEPGTYFAPREITRFISDFDSDKQVEPQSFDFELVRKPDGWEIDDDDDEEDDDCCDEEDDWLNDDDY